MADSKKLLDFRKALVEAHKKAHTATTAAWRAHGRAHQLQLRAQTLAPSISNQRIRDAIAAEVLEIEREAMQAENSSYARRERLSELLLLLGGSRA
jgi:hypothetical protein